MTKYANGHGDAMGGIVIGDKKRIRAIKPLAVNMGADARSRRGVSDGARAQDLLPALRAPLANALAIAEWLTEAQGSRRRSTTRAAERSRPCARAQADDGLRRRADVSISHADKERTWAFIDALELFTTTASLGSTESLVAPVRLYLGTDLSAEEQARALIKDCTVRFAVGIEHVDDLIADVEQALRKSFRLSCYAARNRRARPSAINGK